MAERVAEETDISLGRKSSILNTLLRLAKFRGDQSPVIRDLFRRVSRMRPKRLPRIPTYETALAAISMLKSIRYKAVMLLALEAGLRLGEALALRWDQISLNQNIIIMEKSEKGSEGSILPLTDNLRTILIKLRERYPHSPIVIPHRTEKGIKRQLQRALQAIKRKNPLFENVNVKNLRHIFATMLYARTRDLVYVQRMLRHRSILTTQRYVHMVTGARTYDVVAVNPTDEATIRELLASGYEVACQTKSRIYLRRPKGL